MEIHLQLTIRIFDYIQIYVLSVEKFVILAKKAQNSRRISNKLTYSSAFATNNPALHEAEGRPRVVEEWGEIATFS